VTIHRKVGPCKKAAGGSEGENSICPVQSGTGIKGVFGWIQYGIGRVYRVGGKKVWIDPPQREKRGENSNGPRKRHNLK